MTGFAIYLRLLAYLKPYWWAGVLVIIGNLLNAASEVGGAHLVKYIIDAISHQDQSAKNLFPILIVLMFFFRGVGSFLGSYYISVIARHVVYNLRLEVFDRLLTLSPAYYLSHSSGYLSAKLIYDVEQVTAAATEAGKTMLREGLTVIALFSYLFWMNWRLSLALLLVGPMVAFLVRKASKRLRKLSHQIQDSMGEVSHIVNESITGYSVVKNYGGQAYERERFDRASTSNLKKNLKMVITSSINTPLIQLLMAIAMGIIVWLALRPEILGSSTSAGDFVAYITAAGLISKPLRALTDVNEKIQRGVSAAHSVFALIDTPPEEDHGQVVQPITGQITFKDVSFSYIDETAALTNINLTINAGETIAFVGRSGAGKTTLVNLLMRFQNITQGQILLDGVPIDQFTLANLRSQIATVGQQVILFDQTVRENIAYGQLATKSDAEVRAAAKDAYADQFIDALPNGFDTLIGASGMSLSGGQRQRLAIARALLKDAPILILDEATSALDNESEHYIQQALSHAMVGRTTLVIAHRLSTIEQSDRIVVMDKGRIVEQGTHTELLANNGLYAQLHQRDFVDIE
ncbi:MAG: lipid A export permease/ATP-binding protein MsbA [Aquirhabdus sp.]